MNARARLLRALAIGLAAGGLIVFAGLQAASAHYPPGPAKPCPGGTDAVQHKNAWFVIKAPPGMSHLVAHAAGRPDGTWLLASDGSRVMRSDDGGCTWKSSFSVTTVDTGDAHALPQVSSLYFPGGGDTALMVLDGVGRAAGTQVMRSDDGGATWQPAGTGLPDLGGVRDIVGAPSAPNVLYATVAYNDKVGDNDPAQISGALYRSADGGRTWTKQSQGVQIERVAVDPASPSEVWAVRADHSVARSADGGATWQPVSLPRDPSGALPWRDLAVARAAGKRPTIVVAASPERTGDATAVAASVDDGRSWQLLPSEGLGPIAGVTFGNSANQVLIVSGSQESSFRGPALHAYDIDYHVWRDVDSMQLNSLYDPRRIALSVGARGHEGFGAIEMRRSWPAGSAPDAIARYDPPDPPPNDITVLTPQSCADQPYSPPPPVGHQAVDFKPAELDVHLQPDTPQRVPVDADLAAVPAPLDVYFLIDTTTSMDEPIDGVICSVRRIQRQLGERGVDVWMGVGAYQDRYDYRYKRYADLAAPGPGLVDALQAMRVRQGKEEPMRSGLYQAATGAGLDFTDTDSDFNTGGLRQVHVVVPPGQQASFRPDALHTVVVIGNEPYSPTTPGEPSPDQVVSALKAKKALAIGLQIVQTPEEQIARKDDQRTPDREALMTQQLSFFAGQTGAVAPPGGIDCDGDGQVDIVAGQPLVCRVADNDIRENMSDSLVSVLRTFHEQRDVELVPRRTSGLQVSVENGHAASVDVGKPFDLGSTVVVSCTAAQLGRVFPLTFDVRVGGNAIGSVGGHAQCGRLPKAAAPAPRRHHPAAAHPAPAPAPAPSKSPVAPQPPVPPASPHTPPAVAVAPPPPPPAPAPVSPVPSPSPASAPAAAPSAAAAPAHGGAGLAAVPQQEATPQVATQRTGRDGEHAMLSARRARSTVPEPALVTLGLGGAAAFGWAAWAADERRRRRSLAVQPADRGYPRPPHGR